MIKHIIYRTTDVSTGEYYIGLHKLNILKSRRYWGSFWGHWQPDKANLIRETLAEYPDRESARQAEPLWIEPHLGNPLCKNTHARELPEASDRCGKPSSKGMLGKKASEETKKRISQSNKGKIITSEHREKLRQANLGKKVSEETLSKRLGKSLEQSKIIDCPNCGKSIISRGIGIHRKSCDLKITHS